MRYSFESRNRNIECDLTVLTGRRRKIKCNYPESNPNTASDASSDQQQTSPPTKCIECTTHSRECQIQGFVNSNPVPAPTNVPNNGSGRKGIYKRRRDPGPSPGSDELPDQPNSNGNANANAKGDAYTYEDGYEDDNDERPLPNINIQVDRMESVVARLARGQHDNTMPTGQSTGLITGKKGQYPGTDRSNSNTARTTTTSTTNSNGQASFEEHADETGHPIKPVTEEEPKGWNPLLSQLFNNEVVCTQRASSQHSSFDVYTDPPWSIDTSTSTSRNCLLLIISLRFYTFIHIYTSLFIPANFLILDIRQCSQGVYPPRPPPAHFRLPPVLC